MKPRWIQKGAFLCTYTTFFLPRFCSFIMDTFTKLFFTKPTLDLHHNPIYVHKQAKAKTLLYTSFLCVCECVSETDLVGWGGWRDDLIRKGNFPTVCTQSLLSKGELKEKEKKFNTLDKKLLISIYNLSKKDISAQIFSSE